MAVAAQLSVGHRVTAAMLKSNFGPRTQCAVWIRSGVGKGRFLAWCDVQCKVYFRI